MSWLAFRVEIHTTDERDEAPARIQKRAHRALEREFAAVTLERTDDTDGIWIDGMFCRFLKADA